MTMNTKVSLIIVFVLLFGTNITNTSSQSLEVITISPSPNGSWVVVTRIGGLIDLYNTEGEFIQRLRQSGENVLAISWESNSTRFVTGDYSGKVQIWNTQNFQLERTIHSNLRGIVAVSWNSQNSMIVGASTISAALEIWDSNTGNIVITKSLAELDDVAWYRNSDAMVTLSDGEVITRNSQGDPFRSLSFPYFTGSINIHPFKNYLLLLSVSQGDESSIVVIDFDAEQEIFKKNISPYSINWAYWSPDGAKIAIGVQNGTVVTLSYPSGEVISTYSIPTVLVPFYWRSNEELMIYNNSLGKFETLVINDPYNPYSVPEIHWTTVAWKPDSSQIAAGTSDGTVYITDEFGQSIAQLNVGGSLRGMEWDSTMNRFGTASKNGTVKIWDTNYYTLIAELTLPSAASDITWIPNSNLLATIAVEYGEGTSGQLILWDTNTWQELRRIRAGIALSTSINGDASKLLVAGRGAGAWVVNLSLEEEREMKIELGGQGLDVQVAAWSPSRLIATGSLFGIVKVYGESDSEPLYQFQTNAVEQSVRAIQFSCDSELLAAFSGDGTVTTLNLTTGVTQSERIFRGQRIYGAAFSPDLVKIAFNLEASTQVMTSVVLPDVPLACNTEAES